MIKIKNGKEYRKYIKIYGKLQGNLIKIISDIYFAEAENQLQQGVSMGIIIANKELEIKEALAKYYYESNLNQKGGRNEVLCL